MWIINIDEKKPMFSTEPNALDLNVTNGKETLFFILKLITLPGNMSAYQEKVDFYFFNFFFPAQLGDR